MSNVITDGLFIDSYGNAVKHGSKILIESTYCYANWNNREAIVQWNPEFGMYCFIFKTDIIYKTEHNFYTIRSFRVIS